MLKNKKRIYFVSLFVAFAVFLFIIGVYNTKLNFNDDIKEMGYENVIIANHYKDNKIVLSKKDNSELTQDEMDGIYEYFNLNYINNDKYETNIYYNTNYKDITLEISKK